MAKLDVNDILDLAVFVPKIVKAVQRAFGKEPGSVRKAAAMEATEDFIVITNRLAGREALTAEARALVDEAIEIGVRQKKLYEEELALVERMKAINGLLKAAVKKPQADGVPS